MWQVHGVLVLLISCAFVQEFRKTASDLSSSYFTKYAIRQHFYIVVDKNLMCSQDMVFFTMKKLATATFVISSFKSPLNQKFPLILFLFCLKPH